MIEMLLAVALVVTIICGIVVTGWRMTERYWHDHPPTPGDQQKGV